MKHILIATLITLFSNIAIAQECSIDITRTAANTRYVTSDKGTVTDQLTGLTWMRCQLGKNWDSGTQSCTGTVQTSLWQSALTTVEAINDENGNHVLHQFAGYQKWRMPNIKELVSLKEIACYSPALSTKAFGDTFDFEYGDLSAYVWSNTSAGDGSSVMVFDTINGEVYLYNAAQFEFSTLLVAEQ